MKKIIYTKMKIFLLALLVLSISCYILAAIRLYDSDYSLSSYFKGISDWNIGHKWHLGWGGYNNHLSGDMKKDFPNSIENITIITGSSDISLAPSNESTINLNITGDFDSNYNYSDCIKRFDIDDKNIDIETSKESFFNNVSLNISIPNTYRGNIIIKSHSGTLSISSLTLSNLSLSSTSGDIKLFNIHSNNSDINSTSGDFNCTGSLGDCTISSTSGDIKLNLSGLGNNSSISSKSGTIIASLDNSLGYKADIHTTSGEIETRDSTGKNISINKNYNFTNGDGSKNISINTTSGDILFY